MKVDIRTALSAVAICVSVVALFYSNSVAKQNSIYTASVAQQISSSDYQAAQQVKSDTAKLFSSLISITEKWGLARQLEREGVLYDISKEQEVISDFVNSESANALRAWIGEERDNLSKDWTPFFLILQDLSTASLSEISPEQFADALTLLESLEGTDVEEIVKHNSDLTRLISLSRATTHTPIVQAVLDLYGPMEREELIELLKWLKEDGVNDVNVDMWLGTLTSDTKLVREARAKGVRIASLSTTIDKYCGKLLNAGFELRPLYKRSCEQDQNEWLR